MSRPSKRQQHARRLVELKRQKREDQRKEAEEQQHSPPENAAKRQRRDEPVNEDNDQSNENDRQFDFGDAINLEEHESETSDAEGGIQETDEFKSLFNKAAMEADWSAAKPSYTRGPDYTDRHKRRLRAAERSKAEAAEKNKQSITDFFKPKPTPTPGTQSPAPVEVQPPVQPPAPESPEETQQTKRWEGASLKTARTDLAEAIRRHEKEMKPGLRSRYRAVMAYLNLVEHKTLPTKKDAALAIAHSMDKGPHCSRNIMKWANAWLDERCIPETKRGVSNVTRVINQARMEGEGVFLVAPEHAAQEGTLPAARQHAAQMEGEGVFLAAPEHAAQMEGEEALLAARQHAAQLEEERTLLAAREYAAEMELRDDSYLLMPE